MCLDCGCGEVDRFKVTPMQGSAEQPVKLLRERDAGDTGWHVHEDGTAHSHSHDPHHSHAHSHSHEEAHSHTIAVGQQILARNNLLAERNRGFFLGKGILALNLLSSPGAGKTTLIQKTLASFGTDVPSAVLVGDLETSNDAERIRNDTTPVAQITTGTACHLDAEMVARGIEQLDLDNCRLLLIENVGNLVCPASFDLGEELRVVLFSVTEGEDKPLKYPPIFKMADVVLLTKIDLNEAVEFDRQRALDSISAVAPQAEVIEISSKSGDGLDGWFSFLKRRLKS